jgi:hypothetical protein
VDQQSPSAEAHLTDENSVQAKSAQLLQRQDQDREQVNNDLAGVRRDLEKQWTAIQELRHEGEQTRSWTLINTVLLTALGILMIVMIGAVFASGVLRSPGLLPGPQRSGTSPSRPGPPRERAAQIPPPSFTTAIAPGQESAHPALSGDSVVGTSLAPGVEKFRTRAQSRRGVLDIQSACCCLSSPKGEDVIRSAGDTHYAAHVLADGASSVRRDGGEITGGGAMAARIAAESAITFLTNHLHPAMGIEDMLGLLEDSFRGAGEALERFNASATVPGATTLIIALLAQAGDGVWYWLTGHVGNGVLALLHTGQLLSSWPVTTALLSKHSNGVITITLPGEGGKCIRPALIVKPHQPGDMLVIASDGLDHLDAVTRHENRLTFLNYFWKHVADRSCLERGLRDLENRDGRFTKALSLDDTTIGVILA